MASILIVLDQPTYLSSNDFIATSSTNINTIFAGDIIEGNLDGLAKVRGKRFDTLLIPATITEESSDYEKLREFYGYISGQNPDLKMHRYENQY